MGARTLRDWILHPLLDIDRIKQRQNYVEELSDDDKRTALREILANISDIERAVTRVSAKSASPRDLAGLKNSLIMLESLRNWLKNSSIKEISVKLEKVYDELDTVYNLLLNAIAENPPAKLGEADTIKQGYNEELDELRSVKTSSGEKLQELEKREKEKTGIPSLKVGYNSVFGYYIDITKTHLSKVPYNYVRKQTLVNCERFITEELKEMESQILGAEDKIAKLESYLFTQVREKVSQSANALKIFAKCAAELDVYASLAECAVKNGWIKPQISRDNDLIIEAGRHPVVEAAMAAGEFVPNDIKMDSNLQIMIITGPNMSGKSVYLRQNALLVVMAQTGSFIPAKKAVIGITDRIMTRIGARDILSKGQSTFMVEMKETADILNLATSKTLVLLDEVGRGTSTFDGVSIAWAVAEFLYDLKKGPKVLFATHYFELTELEEKYKGIQNFNVMVKEEQAADGKPELVFLHKVARGPSDKSYGIHVAELAGLNPACVLRARQILKKLETKTELNTKKEKQMLPMFQDHPVIKELNDCKPEKLSPLQALQVLNEWKKRLKHD
jgi:DNA mismatch repair protein MutS